MNKDVLDLQRVSGLLSGDKAVRTHQSIPSDYSVIPACLNFINTTSGSIAAMTADNVASFGPDLTLVNLTNLYADKKVIFVATHYAHVIQSLAGITFSADLVASDFAKLAWYNNLHIAYGNPGSESFRIIGPANPLQATGYIEEPENLPSGPNALYYPKSLNWQAMDYLTFGINQSNESVKYCNTTFNAVSDTWNAAYRVLVMFKGFMITAQNTTKVDMLTIVLRKMGYADTAWKADCLQKTLNGIDCSCHCGRIPRLKIGMNADWKVKALQYIVNGVSMLDTEKPDKITIHRVMGEVRFTNGAMTVPSSSLFGAAKTGVLHSPNLYSLKTGNPSRFRFMVTRVMFTQRLPRQAASIQIYFGTQPGNTQATGVFDVDSHPASSPRLPMWKAGNPAVSDDVTFGQMSLDRMAFPSTVLYLGVNQSEENFYAVQTSSAFTSTIDDHCKLFLYGALIEFNNVSDAIEYDTFMRNTPMLPTGLYRANPADFE